MGCRRFWRGNINRRTCTLGIDRSGTGAGLNVKDVQLQYNTTKTKGANRKNRENLQQGIATAAANKKLKAFQTHATQEGVNQMQHAQKLAQQLERVQSHYKLKDGDDDSRYPTF